MDNNTELEIIKKRNNGLSPTEICKEYNIDLSQYYRIINRNGREKIIPNKKYYVNDSYFKIIDTEDKAYWLGFLYADGYINDTKGCSYLELGLSSVDRNHVILFSKYIKSNHPIKDRTIKYLKKDGTNCLSTHIKIYNTKIVNDLIKLGCTNKKSWSITYPKFLDIEMEPHFIRGYFDGDGSIRKRGVNQYEVNIAGNINFINGLKIALEERSINSYILIRKKDGLATLNISNKKDCLLFYNLIYDAKKTNCFLVRKKSIFDNINTSYPKKTNRTYKIEDPNGNIYTINNGLKNFCIDNGLNYNRVKKSIISKKPVDGWKIEKILERLKLFREFVEVQDDIKVSDKKDISNTTIDDVLKSNFFEKEKDLTIDSRGVYHIKNWKIY